jgi:hypothetical protein
MAAWAMDLAVGRVAVGHSGWVGDAERTINPCVVPGSGLAGLPVLRLEHWHPGAIHVHAVRGYDGPGERVDERWDQTYRLAHHVGQRRSAEVDILAGVDLGLAMQSKVVDVFGEQNMGE